MQVPARGDLRLFARPGLVQRDVHQPGRLPLRRRQLWRLRNRLWHRRRRLPHSTLRRGGLRQRGRIRGTARTATRAHPTTATVSASPVCSQGGTCSTAEVINGTCATGTCVATTTTAAPTTTTTTQTPRQPPRPPAPTTATTAAAAADDHDRPGSEHVQPRAGLLPLRRPAALWREPRRHLHLRDGASFGGAPICRQNSQGECLTLPEATRTAPA